MIEFCISLEWWEIAILFIIISTVAPFLYGFGGEAYKSFKEKKWKK